MIFKGSRSWVLSGVEASAVTTAPPFLVESLHGRSNSSLPRLPLHMHTEDIIPTCLTSNIYIGLCLPKARTLTRLRSYEMFEVLLIVRFNKRVGLRGILNFPLCCSCIMTSVFWRNVVRFERSTNNLSCLSRFRAIEMLGAHQSVSALKSCILPYMSCLGTS